MDVLQVHILVQVRSPIALKLSSGWTNRHSVNGVTSSGLIYPTKKKRWRVSSANGAPQFLYVGGNPRQPVDSVHDSMRLDEITAAPQDLGNFEKQCEISKGIRTSCKRLSLLSVMCFILFSYGEAKFLLGIVMTCETRVFSQASPEKDDFCEQCTCSKRSGR